MSAFEREIVQQIAHLVVEDEGSEGLAPHGSSKMEMPNGQVRRKDIPGSRNFKLGMWVRGMVTGLAMVTVLLGGTALAGEEFATLAGIPAQALSQGEMTAVEGKQYPLIPAVFCWTQSCQAQQINRIMGNQVNFGVGLPPFLSSLGRGVIGFPSTLAASPFGPPVNIPPPSVAIADLCRQIPSLCGRR